MNDNTKNKDLGVFYTCFKENGAIEYSLNKFFELYPEAPVYLVSDNGNDFTYLQTKYPLLKATKETFEVTGMFKNGEIDDFINSNTQETFLKICMEFLRRLNLACEYCKTNYILLMEPDVLVRGKLTMPSADLVGPTVNIMPEEIQQLILKYNGKNNGTWGPAGGIMKTQSFQKIYNKLVEDDSPLKDGLKLDPRIICYDYLLAFLFSIYGYSYEENLEETECLRNPWWRTSGHPLLHQYREQYNNNYEGKWK